ncbi:MAG: SDR family NAD(P)-dependent oxidoreductase [Chloroflexota bacterium]
MAPKILIYGGSGGIGSATGRMLRARGYDLHLVGRDEERLAAIAKELDATTAWRKSPIQRTDNHVYCWNACIRTTWYT